MSRHAAKALLISGSIMAGALGLSYLVAHGFIPDAQREISTRGYNVTIALILVWWTNLAPKRLRPLAEISGDAAIEQSARRFTGRAIVCGGLLSALAWLVAPFGLALPLEAAAIGGALALVCLRPRHRTAA
jgi:hypothetical protein